MRPEYLGSRWLIEAGDGLRFRLVIKLQLKAADLSWSCRASLKSGALLHRELLGFDVRGFETAPYDFSAVSWKARRSAATITPGRPSPIGFPSIDTTGVDMVVALERNASRAS